MTYLVKLVPEVGGAYSVVVPGLPGCVSQGSSKDDALKNISEAIALYLEVAGEIAAERGTETALVEISVT